MHLSKILNLLIIFTVFELNWNGQENLPYELLRVFYSILVVVSLRLLNVLCFNSMELTLSPTLLLKHNNDVKLFVKYFLLGGQNKTRLRGWSKMTGYYCTLYYQAWTIGLFVKNWGLSFSLSIDTKLDGKKLGEKWGWLQTSNIKIIIHKDVFRTMSNIYDGTFCENS